MTTICTGKKEGQQIKYIFLFFLLIPFFLIYFFICLTIPLIKFGKIKKNKGIVFFVRKDIIHADYVFPVNLWEELETEKKYAAIGWGERSMFLETQKWSEVKLNNLIKAFFGINKTVVRIEFLDDIPKNNKKFECNSEQFETIKKHILQSFDLNKLILKKKSDYQIGSYYESELNYNLILTCNNWINLGLKKCKLSNRFWCPLSFWI